MVVRQSRRNRKHDQYNQNKCNNHGLLHLADRLPDVLRNIKPNGQLNIFRQILLNGFQPVIVLIGNSPLLAPGWGV